MNNYTGIIIIAGMCVIVLAIVAFSRKAEFVINFILRAVSGAIGIYFVNQILAWQGIAAGVGINALTVLTSGVLGFPGLVLLYGINVYKIL